MGRKFQPRKTISPAVKLFSQYTQIKKTYGNIEDSQLDRDSFYVVMNIVPSPNSDSYKVKICYRCGYKPKAILLSPPLQQYNNEYPHHIYSHNPDGTASLCVYHPGKDEWNSNIPIATSFIPWVSTWLNTYEYWLITGEWHYDEVVVNEEIKE